MPQLNNFLYKHSIREKIGVGYNNYSKRLLQVKKKKQQGEGVGEDGGRGQW